MFFALIPICVHTSCYIQRDEGILKTFKKRKARGTDELNMEFFRHASTTPKLRFLNILNICCTTYQIPHDWKRAIIINF
jgi:hypothetical protein